MYTKAIPDIIMQIKWHGNGCSDQLIPHEIATALPFKCLVR